MDEGEKRDLLEIANDYLSDQPTTPYNFFLVVWANLNPINKFIIFAILFAWFAIWLRQDSPLVDTNREKPLFESEEEADKFANESVFDGRDTNSSTILDPQSGVTLTDTPNTTVGCFMLGLNCTDASEIIQGNQTDEVLRRDTEYGSLLTNERDQDITSLIDALKKNDCKDLTKEEAVEWMCSRSIRYSIDVYGSLRQNKRCQKEVDAHNCSVWQGCLLNILRKHFSVPEKKRYWFRRTDYYDIGDGMEFEILGNLCRDFEKT